MYFIEEEIPQQGEENSSLRGIPLDVFGPTQKVDRLPS